VPNHHAELPDSGQTPHAIIDQCLPTREEKEGLRQLATTVPDFTDASIRILISGAKVSNPPTDAELDSEFGTPATVGAGFVALLDDDGAGANVTLLASDGTQWWTVSMTKAV
jgi:hypothetical protein